MVHSALVTRFALTTDYSSRGGVRVDSIGHHHAAGTSLAVALSLFQPGGRTVSPNYCIKGKEIVLVVPEEYRAWTSADSWADARSITYEIVNTTGSPDWSFDDDTMDSVIRLDADIRMRYGISARHAIPGFWEHRNLYEWYGRSYPTACAGPSFNINYVIGAVLAGPAGLPGKELTEMPVTTEFQSPGRRPLDAAGVLGPDSIRQQAASPNRGVQALAVGPADTDFLPHVYGENLNEGDVLEVLLIWHNTLTKEDSPHYSERIHGGGDGTFKVNLAFARPTAANTVVVHEVRAIKGAPVITFMGCTVRKWVLK